MDLMDLHSHSNISDGSLSPTELLMLAGQMGLRALALTDHDNLGGLEEALAVAREISIELVPGVEISAEFKKGTMHILGYYVWEGRQNLSLVLEKLQKARAERNPRMIQKMNQLGLEVTLEEVFKFAGGGQIGRPHMAKALMEKGYVSSMDEAFDRYLSKGKPAYEEKFRLSPQESIALIRNAGGVPTLAHPFTLNLNGDPLEALIAELKEYGLEAIEVYSPDHTSGQTQAYQEIAVRLGLAYTGGTDFHGANKPDLQLGIGRGNFRVPYALLNDLKMRRDQIRSTLV